MIVNNKQNREYSSEIVSAFNIIGDNIEALSVEVEEIFKSDERYHELFENDETQDYISDSLNTSFVNYKKYETSTVCEEKVLLAYEWLFEVLLFTTDDEEIKSLITVNSNHITLLETDKIIDNIKENSKIVIKILDGKKIEELCLLVEEIVDGYVYSYLSDNAIESDLIIIPFKNIFTVI